MKIARWRHRQNGNYCLIETDASHNLPEQKISLLMSNAAASKQF